MFLAFQWRQKYREAAGLEPSASGEFDDVPASDFENLIDIRSGDSEMGFPAGNHERIDTETTSCDLWGDSAWAMRACDGNDSRLLTAEGCHRFGRSA